MNDPNRVLKWLLVIGLVVISLIILYPPHRKLKGGIDLVGGSSLLFEIDTTGLSKTETFELSTRIMGILKERVDPKSQLNLEWRPVGHTRLEIRMPRPPAETIARRQAKDAAIDRIKAMNVGRYEVETALNAVDPDARQRALDELQKEVPERAAFLQTLIEADQARRAAIEQRDTQAMEKANEAYEDAMSKLVATSIPLGRLLDVLALAKGPARETELNKLGTQYPAYDKEIGNEPGALSAAVKAFDAWTAEKADLEDPSDLKRRLRGAGVLEFRVLADRDPESPGSTRHDNSALRQAIGEYVDQLAKFGPRPEAGDRYGWFPIDDIMKFFRLKEMKELDAVKDLPGRPVVQEYAGRYYVLAHVDPDSQLAMTRSTAQRKWALKGARIDRNPMTGENVVSFALDPRGGRLFRVLTGANVGRQLCIMLDDTAMSHATINEAIGEHCQISGNFTIEKVQELVNTLEAGSLPARLKETPLAERTIGPSLGQTNREKGMKAAVWGSVLVVVFMVVYYGLAGGGIADLALMLNLLFTLAAMALMQATFTLPGIAGLILTVGMAVDANVLIFERVREERQRGVVFRKALNLGYEKAFSAILDGNLTTLLICVILVFVGSEEVKGFGYTLGIGLATSMFTALTVTRLIFNTLAAKGLLSGFSMRRVIGVPNIDWVGLRRVFWPISLIATTGCVALFLAAGVQNKERIYDIEFLGGTSVQLDLKPEHPLSDEQVTEYITAMGRRESPSAVDWLTQAAGHLEKAAAEASDGEVPGQYKLTSSELTGEQLASLTRNNLQDQLERDGIQVSGNSGIFTIKSHEFTLSIFKEAVREASRHVLTARDRLRRARVQSVGEIGTQSAGLSYEVVTIETNRPVVQAALLAALGDKLAIQQAISYAPTVDEEMTKEPFFVIEAEDHYLSDVLDTDASFDIRSFRGGVAIDVRFSPTEEPLTKEEIETRLREVALQPEFEQFRTRDVAVFPLGAVVQRADGARGHQRFAVCGTDEALHYDDDPAQWRDSLAQPQLGQVEAALGREKSLSKVVQFLPQIATQTKNRAVFALFLSFVAIAVYVWLRFGTKDYGLAVLVTLVHDVAITVGALALCNYLFDNPLARLLLIEDFKVDLSFIAAILTIIGYSLNDTIVVFDRIRENRGRAGTLSAAMINTSINQTLSRTILTSFTVFIVVFVLYVFGGAGIHVFGFALLVGIISGTYSTVAIAVPLVYRPVVLRSVVWIIAGLGAVGIIFAVVDQATVRWVLSGLAVVGCGYALARTTRTSAFPAGHPAAA